MADNNTVFSSSTFDEEPISCSNCNWTGKGADAIKIDLYNVTNTNEIRCPKCDTLLGILPIKNNTGDSGGQLNPRLVNLIGTGLNTP